MLSYSSKTPQNETGGFVQKSVNLNPVCEQLSMSCYQPVEQV